MFTAHAARCAAAIGISAGIIVAGGLPVSAAGLGTAGSSTAESPSPSRSAGPTDSDGSKQAVTPSSEASAIEKDENVRLMSEYDDFWTPRTFDDSSAATKESTGFRGDVTDEGAKILAANDETYQKLNRAAAADETQAHRALVDADYDWKETLPDALGPVLADYFDEGIDDGSLSKSTRAFDAILKNSSTGAAKPYFNFPRPFLADRSFADTDTPNDLKGLKSNLDTARIPDWTDEDGKTHTAEYDELEEGPSQAFPSGHTTFAYEETLLLAELLPELGPEIVTRGSEAGNNRVALGVHYPLDVVGGRILGHAHTATTLNDDYTKDTLLPARKQLVEYLTKRCEADGHGDSLAKCIDDTKANDTGGYTNEFTDAVATEPVTDRASALKVYQQRMTYGFDKVSEYTGTSSQAGDAPRVPDNAANLLITAFPSLNATQRSAVLAATEIDAGYPLDSSSDGWARIDLPAALSAKVTLDGDGKVTKVEPGQPEASVVTEDPQPTPTNSPTPSETPSTPPATESPAPGGNDSGTDDTGSVDSDGAGSDETADGGSGDSGSGGDTGALPRTGADMGLPIGIGAVLIVGGASVLVVARRRRLGADTDA
ncbi:phosphatase PAP2 family protein [Brevibacterium atlanticum]|uniref:phosphatase PAP2 family protein n=1 Tax=Brevibacterium atlanticum TaxID=2697563 RepID=UPI0014239BEA|nr:phosphatase PAP2 family protein [Brevibacterium atlanticum]